MAAFHHTEPKLTNAGQTRNGSDGSISHTINDAELGGANGGIHTYAYPTGDGSGYKGTGGGMSRHITPGGHPVDTSQPAFPIYHRR